MKTTDELIIEERVRTIEERIRNVTARHEKEHQVGQLICIEHGKPDCMDCLAEGKTLKPNLPPQKPKFHSRSWMRLGAYTSMFRVYVVQGHIWKVWRHECGRLMVSPVGGVEFDISAKHLASKLNNYMARELKFEEYKDLVDLL